MQFRDIIVGSVYSMPFQLSLNLVNGKGNIVDLP